MSDEPGTRIVRSGRTDALPESCETCGGEGIVDSDDPDRDDDLCPDCEGYGR